MKLKKMSDLMRKKNREYFRLGNIQSLEKWLDTTDYFVAPASTKYHGCFRGGLYEHSYNVASLLVNWTERLGLAWLDRRSPYLIGMLHDVCKINTYEWDEGEREWTYKDHIYSDAHGSLSIKLIEEQGFKLNEEERACILYHMGTWTKDGDMTYSEAIQKYQNVLWVHTADMFASQILQK
jgi:23S rRNA maturation-related 3'-5' exoribonuclease YhaM